MLSRKEINKIYTDNADKIFRYFYCRIENRAVSEDLTSQTFIKMLDKIDQFDERKASAVTWLFTIARNNLIDYFRSATGKASKKNTDIDDAESFIDPTNVGNKDLENFVQSVRNKAILSKQIKKLPESDRQLLFLRYTQDLSYEEIAAKLGTNVNAVGVRIHRVLSKLHKQLEDAGVIETLDI